MNYTLSQVQLQQYHSCVRDNVLEDNADGHVDEVGVCLGLGVLQPCQVDRELALVAQKPR